MAWLSGWNKRQKITLTGDSSGAQTNYQIKLTVTYDSDMQSNFDDLRFTESDGETFIDAWLESKTDSVTADIWVEFPTTPANGETENYYMYYGNSGVDSNWSLDDTFAVADDFSEANGPINGVNGWVDPAGSASGEFLNNELKITYPAGDNQDIYKNFNFGASYIFDFKVMRHATVGDLYMFSVDSGTDSACLMMQSNGKWSDNIAHSSGSWVIDIWYDVSVINGGGTTWEFKIDGTTIWGDGGFISRTGGRFQTGGYSGTDSGYFKDMRVRKYVANPPTYGFGGEEISSTWLTGWEKRKKITLTGDSSGAQTNYQIKLTVTYDSDMQPDFDDLRFAQAGNGTTILIDAWLESKTDSVTADIWVEFPTTPADTVEQTYYMYYGNVGAPSDWSIANTFVFGDEFADLTNWTTIAGTPSIVSGELNLVYGESVRSTTAYGFTDRVLESRVKMSDTDETRPSAGASDQITSIGDWYDVGDGIIVQHLPGAADTYTYTFNNGARSSNNPSTDYGTGWVVWGIERYSGHARFLYDATQDEDHTTNLPDGSMYIRLEQYDGSGNTGTVYIDWTRIRKYATNPATYAFGGEEDLSAGGRYIHRIAGIFGMQYTGRRSW